MTGEWGAWGHRGVWGHRGLQGPFANGPYGHRPFRPMPDPLIVTLRLDAALFATLDGLRRRHFPVARNVVPAHVSLFHALPGDREADVRRILSDAAARTEAFGVSLPGVRSLGRGVAAAFEGGASLGALHRSLVGAIEAALGPEAITAQDRQPLRPHVTIQNKGTPEAARETLAHLAVSWTPLVGRAEGLDLWHYRGGPWDAAATFDFAATDTSGDAAPYRPIDCGLYDRVEAAALRGVPVRLRLGGGDPAGRVAVIADVFARDGADWLRLDGGEVLRLDRVVSVEPL